MSDPLSYLPLAIAGANGILDGVEARRLVAAGVALLQRTAPLVRALHGRRSALLLDGGPALLVALGASEGRSALLLDPSAPPGEMERLLARAGAGAAFTTCARESSLPATLPRVLLDEVPARAIWQVGDESRTIDLTMHAGLHLEGEGDVAGADEEALIVAPSEGNGDALGDRLTHHHLLASARATARAMRLGPRDHTLTLAAPSRPFGLVAGVIAPLLAGGRVTSGHALSPASLVERLEHDGVSMLVAAPGDFTTILGEVARRGRPLDAPVLQHCIAGGRAIDERLRSRWYDQAGVPLLRGNVAADDEGFVIGAGAPPTA